MVLRPVVCLASLIAASTASAPDGPQNWITQSSPKALGKKPFTVLMKWVFASVAISRVWYGRPESSCAFSA
ncbi:Uncharacterised protein [Vibrio cholerae]|nr:Uncharacterised protein [Vibrio cholerae]CSD20696.1 Uncharacterised protein [Vibrio cholerae]